jgi:hypothetical protein
VPVRLIAFFIGLLFAVNGWAEVTVSKDSQEDSIYVLPHHVNQGLSCLERNNNDGVEELWLINFQSEKVSHWYRMGVELKEYPITRVNQKTIAWTQISDVPPDINYVYVLDRETMRQSGTQVSIDSSGKPKIKARWFSECRMLSYTKLNAIIEKEAEENKK